MRETARWIRGCSRAGWRRTRCWRTGGAISFHHLDGQEHLITYLSDERPAELSFCDTIFKAIPVPKALRHYEGGVTEGHRMGLPVRVTTVERTLVDMLDRLDLGDGVKRLWDWFRLVDLNGEALVEYALALGNRTVAGRLGYFLEELGARNGLLDRLEKAGPDSPGYFDRHASRAHGNYLHRWRLVVPYKLWKYIEKDRSPRADLLGRMHFEDEEEDDD
jgi:hypothetical protein